MAGLLQGFHRMRANKTRTAGNKNVHNASDTRSTDLRAWNPRFRIASDVLINAEIDFNREQRITEVGQQIIAVMAILPVYAAGFSATILQFKSAIFAFSAIVHDSPPV